VLGKFFAAWAVVALALALTAPMVITVCYLGDPDPGPIVASYLGSMLLAGTYLAIGGFFSCLTRSQVISLVLAAVACALFLLAGSPMLLEFASGILPAWMVGALESLSLQSRFESMQRGVIELRDLALFGLLTAGWLWANVVALRERMAAG
jgi:ABC-2 type transport system permease protein